MPPGIVVEAGDDGRVRILVDSTACADRFRSVGGFGSEFANLMVLNQVLGSLPQTDDITTAAVRATGSVHMVEAFAPKDGVEAMIASQAVALHMLTMETVRRAQIPGQPVEATSRLRRDAANTARAMMDMTEALERRRGKGLQTIRVEPVVIQDGGQAIVGHVGTPPRRGVKSGRVVLVQRSASGRFPGSTGLLGGRGGVDRRSYRLRGFLPGRLRRRGLYSLGRELLDRRGSGLRIVMLAFGLTPMMIVLAVRMAALLQKLMGSGADRGFAVLLHGVLSGRPAASCLGPPKPASACARQASSPVGAGRASTCRQPSGAMVPRSAARSAATVG